MAYTRWLSEQTGKRYRLPTEAEWEYAARAGKQTTYWWGPEIGEGQANYKGCGSRWGSEQTVRVGSFKPDSWSLYEMLGNVWEWAASAYTEDYEDAELECVNEESEAERVIRSNSWDSFPRLVRSASRNGYWSGCRDTNLGFRLAQDL